MYFRTENKQIELTYETEGKILKFYDKGKHNICLTQQRVQPNTDTPSC